MKVQNMECRPVSVAGEDYEIVVFKDADEPFQTYFRVMKDKKAFPLKVMGGQLSYVTFSVSDEVEQDARAEGSPSPLEALFAEARRMIEATANG